jgi:hypothetical protein
MPTNTNATRGYLAVLRNNLYNYAWTFGVSKKQVKELAKEKEFKTFTIGAYRALKVEIQARYEQAVGHKPGG